MRSCIIFSMILAAAAFAAIVPVDRAQRVAENYYQNYAPPSAKNSTIKQVLTKEYFGQPTWYVFEFTKGWIIVAADDAVRPILGYSFESTVDEDLYNMQNPFVARFSSYDKQIVHNVREGSYVNYEGRRQWKNIENGVFPVHSASKSSAGPLLETTWHQNYPFNDQCPEGTPTGPVATAMHQIMRFHLGPSQGAGSNSYNDSSGDITGTHSVDFSSQTYDWSLMMTLNGSTSTQAEVDELAKMAYHLGVSVNMDYNTDGSGAFMTDARDAYENNWTAEAATLVNTGTITDPASQYTTIMANINDNRPIQWAGSSAGSGGHSFVLDGYNIETENGIYQYHFNWGWGGSYDGWYRLDALTPGATDFSESQQYIHNIEVGGWDPYIHAPPTNASATVIDLENILLDWEWEYDTLTLSHFEISRDNEPIATIPDSLREYTDISLPQGDYEYRITSFYSSSSNSYSADCIISAEIAAEDSFPAPYFTQEASVELYNRQKIELAWAKPFIGTECLNEDFETSGGIYEMVTNGWIQKASDSFPSNSWEDVVDAGWKYISCYGGTYYYDNTYEGIWAAYCNYFYGDDNSNYTYLLSNDPLSIAGNTVLSLWFKSATRDTDIQIVKYTGDFTEADPSLFTEIIATISPDTTATWEYKHIYIPEGTYRIGLLKDTTKGWSFIDNLFIGSDTYPDGNQPVSYDIYRNDELADNIPVTGLYEQHEDITFKEDWNEYSIRAVYPTGISLKSKPTKVYIDANPVPLSLSGSYDVADNVVDLSWYYPGHYPPHWFGYLYETDTFSYQEWDYGDRYLLKNITVFDQLDFNMTFPIYIDKVGASFYGNVNIDNFWKSDQFRFIIYEGSLSSEDIIYTSPWLTADPSGEWCDHQLTETLTLNEKWYVAVEPGDPASGTPNIMLNLHGYEDEPVWHSLYNHSSSLTSSGMLTALNYMDYSIMCYGYNDKPVITKTNPSGVDTVINNIVPEQNGTGNFIKIKPDREDRFYSGITDRKALESYNIYRNGTLYDTATGTSYRDTSPLLSNEYYITAVYSNPPGESEPSNVVEVDINSIGDSNIPTQTFLRQNYPNPFNPVTQIRFALAKTADVELNVYNITGQLVSQLVKGVTEAGYHAVDFDGSKLNSGVYYYTLKVNGESLTERMVLIK